MLNNDFDNQIKDLLENHSAPYDPADWDRMEDMLQSMPQQPGSSSSGGAGSSASVTGIKALVVGAGLAITGVNAALYYQHTRQQAEVVAAQPAAAAAQTPAASAEQPDVTPETASSEPAAAAAAAAAAQTEAPAAAATDKASVTARPRTVRSSAEQAVPAAGQQALPALYQPLLSGTGVPAPAAAALPSVSPCAANARPAVPFVLAGKDTITDWKVRLTACEPLTLVLPAQDADLSDKLTITTNAGQVLPGAATLSMAGSRTATLRLAPTEEMAQAEPYQLQVTVQDNRCAASARTYTLALQVLSAGTARLQGDSVLQKGQSLRLQVKDAQPGSAISWIAGKGLPQGATGAEVEVAPKASTVYVARIIPPAGCAYTRSLAVRVVEDPAANMLPPNVITPNGDQFNEYFIVPGFAEGQMDLEIYDRFGRLTHHDASYRNNWNAAGAEDGIYHFLVRDKRTGRSYKGVLEVKR